MAVSVYISYLYYLFFLSSFRCLSSRFWQIQYGNPDKLCVPLVEANKNGGDLVVSSFSFRSFFTYARCIYIYDLRSYMLEEQENSFCKLNICIC